MSSRYAATPPGTGLGALLAAVRLADVPDEALLEVVHAQYRQLAYQQRQFWAALAELAHRVPMNLPDAEQWTPERVFDSAVSELTAELRLSRPSAERELDHALTLDAMPQVAAALAAGTLDRTRAVVLLDGCADLTEAHRAKLLATVLPDAATVTVATLKARVQRTAIALDPDWAERRYHQSLRQRRVVHYLDQDGTITLAGQNQPADQALAAKAHLTALAQAAQRAGATATLDVLRSVLFLGLLDARFTGRTHTQIIADLVAEFPPPAAQDRPVDPPVDPQPASPLPTAADPPAAQVPSGVELRVGLAVLMGLSEQPGEIAGVGPVLAPVARELAERQRRGQWRYAIVDPDGRLLFDGVTRQRPPGYPTGGAPGGIVELHVPEHLLDPAVIAEHPAWARLLTDLATQYARRAPIEQDPTARFPGRRLRRRVEITHRHCIFPACRRPATDSQADHRHDHARHGPTSETNLAPLCQRHHDLKTRWSWRLTKPDASTYTWISPLGRRHEVPIEPVAPPLPDPMDPGRRSPVERERAG
ncbi:MAG TPA: hypothetical protein VHC23_01095 [Jatrophihabitans sp.]|nr:hypothetical protein [Jatrophihabitans sp.]